MRKVSTLVGITLSALAATASAKEATPAPASAAPAAAPSAAVSANTAAPAASPVASPEANLASPATAAPAATNAVVAPSAPSAEQRRKIEVALTFLPMSMGRYTYSDTFTSTASTEAYFAYGFGISGGYEVLPGLIVGLAPQVIFNVKPKPLESASPATAKQIDILARIAYGIRIETISVYAELMPGYSSIRASDDASPSNGFVLAFGGGVNADMTDRIFLTLGAGYQVGFQNQSAGVHELQLRTKFVRVAMGGGMRF